jgi:hypothetical protein
MNGSEARRCDLDNETRESSRGSPSALMCRRELLRVSLLATALDDADPDAAGITEILDAIPGAWERTQDGPAQAARSEGTPLDELA